MSFMCSSGAIFRCSRTPLTSRQPTPRMATGAKAERLRMRALENRRVPLGADPPLDREQAPRDDAEDQERGQEDEPALGDVHEPLAELRVHEEHEEAGQEHAHAVE